MGVRGLLCVLFVFCDSEFSDKGMTFAEETHFASLEALAKSASPAPAARHKVASGEARSAA